MRQYESTIDRVRDLMGPGNPVPADKVAGSWDDQLGQQGYQRIVAATGAGGGPAADTGTSAGRSRPSRLPGGLSPRGGKAWRILAPAGAGLAVVGLAVGITVAAGSHAAKPGTGGPAGKGADRSARVAADMPPWYVALSENSAIQVIATVHSSQTGQVLTQLPLPINLARGLGLADEPSGNAFLIYGGTPGGEGATYLLTVSADGRSAKLRRLPLVLVPPRSKWLVEGIAISPDGKQLAATLEQAGNSLKTRAEIRVYSLTGGPTRTWAAPSDPGSAFSPVWTGADQLTFVWQDHLYGSAQYFYLGNSEVRVLNTSAPGRDFVTDSTVISFETGKNSLIQTAGAGPADSPLAVALINVTSVGGSGTELLQLDEVSAASSVGKVLVSESRSYQGEVQEGLISAKCQVLGVAADGAMLAEDGGFGEIVDGTFTPLPHNSGVFAAAW